MREELHQLVDQLPEAELPGILLASLMFERSNVLSIWLPSSG
jgi:hypothetical protein